MKVKIWINSLVIIINYLKISFYLKNCKFSFQTLSLYKSIFSFCIYKNVMFLRKTCRKNIFVLNNKNNSKLNNRDYVVNEWKREKTVYKIVVAQTKKGLKNNGRDEQDRERQWYEDKCQKYQSDDSLQEWKQTRRW